MRTPTHAALAALAAFGLTACGGPDRDDVASGGSALRAGGATEPASAAGPARAGHPLPPVHADPPSLPPTAHPPPSAPPGAPPPAIVPPPPAVVPPPPAVVPPSPPAPSPSADPAPVVQPAPVAEPASSLPPVDSSSSPPPAAAPPAPAPRPAAVVRFSGSDRPDVYLPLLDLHGIDELLITVDWTGVTAGGCERLELFGPTGRLYAQPATAFVEGTSNATVAVTANPDGSWRVRHAIPIAGAPPDLYDMAGNWSADATLCDGGNYGSAGVDLE